MKSGMFGRNGVIMLWVTSDGWVVNGNWRATYHEATDEVSCEPDGIRSQRICDYVPRLDKGDYNDVIEAHRKWLEKSELQCGS